MSFISLCVAVLLFALVEAQQCAPSVTAEPGIYLPQYNGDSLYGLRVNATAYSVIVYNGTYRSIGGDVGLALIVNGRLSARNFSINAQGSLVGDKAVPVPMIVDSVSWVTGELYSPTSYYIATSNNISLPPWFPNPRRGSTCANGCLGEALVENKRYHDWVARIYANKPVNVKFDHIEGHTLQVSNYGISTGAYIAHIHPDDLSETEYYECPGIDPDRPFIWVVSTAFKYQGNRTVQQRKISKEKFYENSTIPIEKRFSQYLLLSGASFCGKPDNVVYYVIGPTDISVKSIWVKGSIIATDSSIDENGSQITGYIRCTTYYHSCQINRLSCPVG